MLFEIILIALALTAALLGVLIIAAVFILMSDAAMSSNGRYEDHDGMDFEGTVLDTEYDDEAVECAVGQGRIRHDRPTDRS